MLAIRFREREIPLGDVTKSLSEVQTLINILHGQRLPSKDSIKDQHHGLIMPLTNILTKSSGRYSNVNSAASIYNCLLASSDKKIKSNLNLIVFYEGA